MGKSAKEGIVPKEYIPNRWYGQHARSHEDCDTQGEPHCPPDCPGSTLVALDDSALKVGWTKNQAHVEVAVVRDRDGSHDSDPDAWHMQFDRQGLNQAIKLLRKARDDAFGRDE